MPQRGLSRGGGGRRRSGVEIGEEGVLELQAFRNQTRKMMCTGVRGVCHQLQGSQTYHCITLLMLRMRRARVSEREGGCMRASFR